ncbi:mannose-6-phosphate isomerase, class I [Streptacidiphilus fuscans]|uniref:mannose-6-phosphate isomerase n=1 Tax=Streptacidiphilus fuscans TaxID=2789292 RepID=A0A931BB49_9ACTN|nr:mannose-6-phosphate isomerase, class I [Streptacidiphilus fuscans]MBF9073331.1 mannose-6-phosphate isomerase, class I [Streptacidiphilus fuscans]
MDRLATTIRPYAWGSRTALPALLGAEPTEDPQAELWMGAHSGAPSGVDRGHGAQTLDQVIAADPERELGAATVRRFGPTLPFLFKVLAAGEPLSVQVHPDLAQAQAGFAAEEARGIPLSARERNYRDANHKPEMLCALDEFTGVCGFRRPERTAALLDRLGVPGLRPVADVLRAKPEPEALREALTLVLTLDQASVPALVAETAEALRRLAAEAASDEAEAVAFADYAALADYYPNDPGLLSALLLNHVVLRPGQAIYLGAGVPHAYFRGLGVELMANSDNVLRAGLTPKHIDVPELLAVVRFEATDPSVVPSESVPGNPGEQLYPVPIDEFRLSRYELGEWPLPTGTPQIVLCTSGEATLTDAAGQRLTLSPGQSCFIPADNPAVTATGSATTIFRATVTL